MRHRDRRRTTILGTSLFLELSSLLILNTIRVLTSVVLRTEIVLVSFALYEAKRKLGPGRSS
eukprot:scaffold15978_cov43-Attheya_sp.AAC.2